MLNVYFFGHSKNRTLVWASQRGYLEIVKYLLVKGADIRTCIRATYSAGLFKHLEIVKYLKQHIEENINE